jgi:hypothetical protein
MKTKTRRICPRGIGVVAGLMRGEAALAWLEVGGPEGEMRMELWEWHPDVDGWRDSEGGRQERFWAGVCRDTLFVLG